jgi:hypothetical protein
MRKYSLTEEHRAQLKPWAERWIRNAMSTAAMTEEDRNICIGAVKRLYRAANLEPPPDRRIIFVSSPFVMRFAAGFAAWIWYCHRNKTRDATRAATYAATRAATDAATRDATYDENQWFILNGDLVRLAHELGVGKAGLQCAYNAYNFWQGGNQWSGWDAFLSFFRHIVKLDINYAAYESWETLSLHSGPRCVHTEFCIISDRPEVLLVDDQNRPHNATGPFCRWRDGSELYSFHGTRMPARIIRHPESITAKEILAEQNAEVRRVMIECMGMERFIAEAGAKSIHEDEFGELFSVDLPGDPEGKLVTVRVYNSTPEPDGSRKPYFLRVDPECRPLFVGGKKGKPQKQTATNAVAASFGKTGKEYAAYLIAQT